MSATAVSMPELCSHQLPRENCAYCCPKTPYFVQPRQHPCVAGHCGKCGAPYTMDLMAGLMGPPKFIPSCKCWNVTP